MTYSINALLPIAETVVRTVPDAHVIVQIQQARKRFKELYPALVVPQLGEWVEALEEVARVEERERWWNK